MTEPNVLLLQPILSHYRIPVLKGLSASQRMHMSIAYGEKFIDDSLKSEAPPPGVRSIPLSNVYFGPGNHFLYQKGLMDVLRQGGFDMIIAGFDVHILSNILAFYFARRRGIRFVWWGHGIGPRRSWVSKWIRMRLARSADALIFYNQEQADLFQSWGLPGEKLFVAWNSIDTEEIGRFSREWRQSDRHRVLFIGRLIPEKKVRLLIEAFAYAIPHLKPDTKLTIIGDGPERPALESLTRDQGISNRVEFAGSLFEDSQTAPFFNSSFLSVSPGYVGLSAIHSLAYGVPMLVARQEPHSPEIAAVKEGVNAVFFESNNVRHLSDEIIRLSEHPELLETMSCEGKRVIAERFSVDAMVKSFEDATAHALSQKD